VGVFLCFLEVEERDVETVAPKTGQKVILVSGRNKGSRGTLLEKSSKKNKVSRLQQLSAVYRRWNTILNLVRSALRIRRQEGYHFFKIFKPI